MLKKAGIVVAIAATGLLAVSPLAFAGEGHKDRGHEHYGHSVSIDDSELVQENEFCNNDQDQTAKQYIDDREFNAPAPVPGPPAQPAPPVLGALAPVLTPVQANVQCNNVEVVSDEGLETVLAPVNGLLGVEGDVDAAPAAPPAPAPAPAPAPLPVLG